MVEGIHGCLMHWVIDDLYGRINRVRPLWKQGVVEK